MQKQISEHAAAAKAIKAELKAAFPTVKFSVRSESFSMGDAVRIGWVDGPTTSQVNEIVSKYQYGSFNGMEDLYEYDNKIDGLPQTKYITTHRKHSPEADVMICAELGYDAEAFKDGYDDNANEYCATMVYRAFAQRSFVDAPPVVTPEPEIQTEVIAPAPKIVTVTFPSVNKNNTLAENFEAMVMYGTNDNKCEIKKTIELNRYLFDGIANSLLENRAELWEQIGGAYSDAPEFEGLTSEQVFSNERLVKIFRDTCLVQVVEVKCIETGKAFYVNTEGYDYARYVGVITNNNRIAD